MNTQAMHEKHFRHAAGFTLIELMIAVAILAIIAAVAIPSYREYVATAARGQAKAALLNAVQMEERYFTNNNTYLAIATASATTLIPSYSGADFNSRKYNITVAAGTTGNIATSFTATATPSNGFSDATCGALSINNLGTKTSAAGTVATCWK